MTVSLPQPNLASRPITASPTHRVVAGLLAAIAWFALLLQLALSLRIAAHNGHSWLQGLIAYFGFFTILTNLFVAIVCSAGALFGTRTALYRASIVGAMTTAILVVGICYHFLLRMIWSPQGAQWLADVTLHYVVPIGAAIHWLVYPHAERLSMRAPIVWCVYPVAYFGYAMMRGAWLGTYPYPFIDVNALGYARTLVNAIGVLVAFLVVGYLVLIVARALGAPRSTRATGR